MKTKAQLINELKRKKTEEISIQKAFLYMLAIPLNVLVNDYWSKSAKTRAPKFIEDCLSLYESVQSGAVSNEELADLLENMAGVTIQAKWLERENGRKKKLES